MTIDAELALWRKHLELWRADVERVQRSYESMTNLQWDRHVGLTADEQIAMHRSWAATMTAWWEMSDVIKSLRAALYRMPSRADLAATDAEKERQT